MPCAGGAWGGSLASIAHLLGQAVRWHRQASSYLLDAQAQLDALADDQFAGANTDLEQRRLAARMHELAQSGLIGWAGQRLDASIVDRPLGGHVQVDQPLFLKIGEARPVADAGFWVPAPFIGAGHLVIDTDTRDPGVAGWLRGILLRTLALLPDGMLRVLLVDGASLGTVFASFRPLVDAQAWTTPAVDISGFRAVLEEAEAQISAVQAGEATNPPVLVMAVAALPSGTGRTDWARLAAVAHAGPHARVHMLVAGYPPPHGYGDAPPVFDYTTPLSAAGEGWYRMSQPPGPHLLADDGSGLPCPIRLDKGPSEDLIVQVARKCAASATAASRTDFAALMPAQIWQESSAHGLRSVVGRDGRTPYELVLDDATPHMQIAGRSGSGKTNLLLILLYGLASRYSPDELGLYLLDFKEGVSFVEFTPTRTDPSWIPQAKTVGIESDREYGLAVLRALGREMNRRAGLLKDAGVTKLADLRAAQPDAPIPRLLAVIDEFQVLFAGNDTIARDAGAVLEDLARKGRSYGIHLILASQTIAGIEALYTKKDSIFGQFPLRIALPGGSSILDALNNAADALPVGTAV